MKPDGTDSFSTAASGRLVSPGGNSDTGSGMRSGSEVEAYLSPGCTTWSYLFVHHSKVQGMEGLLARDRMTYFVHKTMRYYRKPGRRNVQHKEVPTVSGLVFLQGHPRNLQAYLSDNFPYIHLCRNCSTGRVAEIPDTQMRLFMRVNAVSPERIRFLLHPFHYYARNRILLRITTGELAGLEGYIIRIDRDRRLVMDVGGLSVAISGVHAEHFEEVAQPCVSVAGDNLFGQRNLHERQALIDRYFHPVKTDAEVMAQAADIDYLRRYAHDEVSQGRMPLSEAWSLYFFVIEEVAYYYAPLIEQHRERLAPILRSGRQVLQEMESILSSAHGDDDTTLRHQAEYQELMTKYGYLLVGEE